MLRRPTALAWLAVAAVLLAALVGVDWLSGARFGPVAPVGPVAPTSVPDASGAAAASGTAPGPAATIRPTPTVPAVDPESGLRTIRRAALPKQAQLTLDLIMAGGPFPYAQDGTTYRNLERLLPIRAGGYYREYTVATPGQADRGARRLVTGRGGELYWTADHYASFWRIVP
jgi:ribonuclease T1